MINFLRRIRRNLINENKTSIYLIYAVGEVVLVVFGILIAFQIDNWNESKILTKKEIANGAEYYQISLDSYDILLSNFYNSPQSIPEDSIRGLFLDMVLPWKLVFNTVRENISQLYGYEYRIILDYNNITVTEFREDFVPLLSDNVNIHKVLSTSELDYLKNDLGINSRLRGMVYRRQHLREYFLDVKPIVEQLLTDIETEIEQREDRQLRKANKK